MMRRTIRCHRLQIRASLALALLFISLLSLGCARQVDVIPIRKKPLPSGVVETIEKRSGATYYKLRISHLLPPSDLDSEANIYILWAVSSNGAAEKLAILKGAIKGVKTLEVATSIADPKFLITAEAGPNSPNPGGPVAVKEFTKEISMKKAQKEKIQTFCAFSAFCPFF
jgi:hypothetical protein